MGNEVDPHTPHWHGKLVQINGEYPDVAELLPASMKSADMLADNSSQGMYHRDVADHITAGVTSLYRVQKKSNNTKTLAISPLIGERNGIGVLPGFVEPGLFLENTSEDAGNSASSSVKIIGKIGLRGNDEVLGNHRGESQQKPVGVGA